MKIKSLACSTLSLSMLLISVTAPVWQSPAIAAQTPAKKPISKTGLLEAVRLNGLSTAELIERVRQRGVNFRLSAADESEFRAAGAAPELIAAIRANYRATPEGITSADSAIGKIAVPPGPPLSKNEVITLLQSGTPSAQVERFVSARGVNFTLTTTAAREITAAGGGRSLLSLIGDKNTRKPAPVSATAPAKDTRRGEPQYEELTDQATSALRSGDPKSAVRLLQRAVSISPARPDAYALLGYAQLYGLRNVYEAEQFMRAAIEHGGAAAFRVLYENDLPGSLFVTRTGVSFRSDSGQLTFEARGASVRDVKLNGLLDGRHGAFHLKITEPNGKDRKIDFTPISKEKSESLLVLNLVRSYR
jgi:hypothetical protein